MPPDLKTGGVLRSALFLRKDMEAWGTIDQERMQADVHGEREAGDADLANLAAINVIQNGGRVYVLQAAEMPSGSQMAALFRY